MAHLPVPLLKTNYQRLSQQYPLLVEAITRLEKKAPYLLGISGGADSVALLDLMLEWGYQKPILCHLHHHLRNQEADKDAMFVLELAKKYDLLVEIGHANIAQEATTKKYSLELAAREARYHFFSRMAKRHDCQQLLLAHHRNDQIETFLFRLFRGSSSRGLRGILPYQRRNIDGIELEILRPLLSFSRKEIINYLSFLNLSWCEDSSNQELYATRNKIRHQLLPLLQEIFGSSYEEALSRRMILLREEEAFLASTTPPLAIEEKISLKQLRELPLPLQRRVIYEWLLHHRISDPGFQEVSLIMGLLTQPSPAKVNLPGNRYARRRAGFLFLT